MSLRDELIEALARTLYGERADLPEAQIHAENALDAILDALAENAIEWEGKIIAEFGPFSCGEDLRRALAVLRESDQ